MTLDEKLEFLLDELAEIDDPDKSVKYALNELFYTAYETGFIEYKIYDPVDILKLVKLVEKYGNDLPAELRM